MSESNLRSAVTTLTNLGLTLKRVADSEQAPTAYHTGVSVAIFFDTVDEMRKARAIIGGKWARTDTPDHGTVIWESADQTMRLFVYKTTTGTCTRVQTGTKHVEAQAAHDEPVYQWVCNPEP